MSSSKGRVVTTLAGNFGRLWKRGHESFSSNHRRILSVQGKGATTYLQGLVTCDLTQPPTPPREEEEQFDDYQSNDTSDTSKESTELGVEFSDKLRAACFLDNKGRILTDSLLWKVDEEQYYIDVPVDTADTLLGHLKQFILRRTKVKVKDESSNMTTHVVFGTLNAHGTPEGFMAAVDPRHPSLGMRVLSLSQQQEENDKQNQVFTKMMSGQFPDAPGTYELIRKLAGVTEGIESQGRVAAEANQEFLNAVSFTKGCYLGQELTARVQYTGAVRKRIMPLFMINVNMQVPRPWLIASQIQSKGFRTADPNSNSTDEEKKDEIHEIREQSDKLPRLPRLSASAAGSMVAMMSGSVPSSPDDDEKSQDSSELEEIKAQTDALFEQLQMYKAGDKIYDTKDGKTIGQIVATPAEGTNVLLAQMRLDRVGLLHGPNAAWTHTNKVTIGEDSDGSGSSPLRYLPYLPLWWPPFDPETGKAKTS